MEITEESTNNTVNLNPNYNMNLRNPFRIKAFVEHDTDMVCVYMIGLSGLETKPKTCYFEMYAFAPRQRIMHLLMDLTDRFIAQFSYSI